MSPILTSRSHGQGMLEYGLIMLFVVLVVFGGLLLLGPQIALVFGALHTAL
jgi:Flp pilus assembly pilin Flp